MSLRIPALLAASAMLGLLILASPASAGQRVALVIGNASYAHAPSLANPLNDATDIGASLERLGFAVTELPNASRAELWDGLQKFSLAASASEMAMVFYAGHGIEVDKRNFLVPVDARLQSDADVEFEAVPLDLLSRAVERAKGLRLIILDACRDNPFAVAMQRSGATRSIGRGLASVEPSGETLVAYAAKEGTVAADGEGRNSPYTTALLAHLEEPGLEVGLMFRKVRDAVLAATGGNQEPFVYGSLSSEGAYLTARPEPEEPETIVRPGPEDTTPELVVPGNDRRLSAEELAADRVFWESVKDSTHAADFEAYLEQYRGGTYEALARNRLARLSGPQEEKTDVHVAVTPDEQEPLVSPEPLMPTPETVEASLELERKERRQIQIGLASLGFDPGPADGLFGQRTRAAIEEWQTSQGFAATGHLDAEGAKTLMAAEEKVARERQSTLSQQAEDILFMASQAAQREKGGAERARTLAYIASAQAEIDNIDGAVQSLSDALAAARLEEDPSDHVRAILHIAEVQAQIGDEQGAAQSLSDAVAAARLEEDPSDRAWAFIRIAEAQANAGDERGAAQSFSEARATAAQQEDEASRFWKYFYIAKAQAETGDDRGAAQSFFDARALAQRASGYVGIRFDWFLDIAEAQLEVRDLQGAMQSLSDARAEATMIESGYGRAHSFVRLAKAQAEAGDSRGATQSFFDARSAAQSIDSKFKWERPRAFAIIAEAQAKSGDTRSAAQSLSDAWDSAQQDTKGYSLPLIAQAQASIGDIRGALATLSRVQPGGLHVRVYAQREIIKAQVKVGDFQGALATAYGIQEDASRSDMLFYIISAQVEDGDIEGAMANLEKVWEEVNRNRLLSMIALAQANSDNSHGALTTAQRIEDAGTRARTLAGIATALFGTAKQAF